MENKTFNNTAHTAVSSPLINAITLMIQQYGIGKASNMVGVSKHFLRQIINGDTVIRGDDRLTSALDDLMLLRKDFMDLVLEKDKQIAGITEIIIKHLI